MTKTPLASRGRRTVACVLALSFLMGPWAAMPAHAAAPTTAPMVLFAITNSQSMDGTTSGAIMVGSGSLDATNTSLNASSSPVSYTVPTGFTPPVVAPVAPATTAPYTAVCAGSASLCDNSPSRMNLTKASIASVLSTYANFLNFGIYTYSTSGTSLYTTWQYIMSPMTTGFTFTNTAGATTVANPCYGYTTATSSVLSNCQAINPHYPGGIAGFKYMVTSVTSDAPTVNDVLYASGQPSVYINYGGTSPATPYPPNKSLSDYNNGNVGIGYASALPSNANKYTGPTNAGYVPYSPEVMYAERGFGYYVSNLSATTGSAKVAMSSDVSTFATALAPETNSSGSSEIKSLAYQSPIGGLLAGALTYLNGLSAATCQGKYVVLLTDGLPTMDKAGHPWPPLGSTSGTAYGLTATFNADGSYATTNDTALSDTIASVAALKAAGINVYVIGLGAGVDPTVNPMAAKTLQAMAIAGGTGAYFPATDANALNTAMNVIVTQIYTTSQIAAPITPISVSAGTSLQYVLKSIPAPLAGSVQAFPVSAAGVPAANYTWDAANMMNASNRAALLKSNNSDGTIKTLANVDATQYGLTATTCVPNVQTIANYTIDPTSYSTVSCNYLGARQSGSFLSSFSSQNTGRYAGPPNSSALVDDPTYTTYVKNNAARTPMLLFTDNDGFLYSVSATSGALLWGWTPPSVLNKMQNFATFQTSHYMDGNFLVVDAVDSNGVWGSYVIGSTQSGAEHFSMKLNTSGTPGNIVYDSGTIANGSSAGDKLGATGSVPLQQTPQVVYLKSGATTTGAVYVYVVTVGSTSTLYEMKVGAAAALAQQVTSAALPSGIVVSSSLFINTQSRQMWFGTTTGQIWNLTISGNAALDVQTMPTTASATMVSPADNATVVKPVLYVGYSESNGIPYVYGATASQVTLFGVGNGNGNGGWSPIWAATPTAGYLYGNNAFAASANVSALTASGVISDTPVIIDNTLLLPVYVPPSGCGLGSAYYDNYGLVSGGAPNPNLTVNGVPLGSSLYLGTGVALTPSAAFANDTVKANPGCTGTCNANNQISDPAKQYITPIGWRQQ